MLHFQELVVLLEFMYCYGIPFYFISHIIAFCRIIYCRCCTFVGLYIAVLLICVRIIVSTLAHHGVCWSLFCGLAGVGPWSKI